MTLSEAKEAAVKINGQMLPYDYNRNVWGFFAAEDSGLPAVFITKDTARDCLHGVFVDDGEHDGFINYETGEEVDSRDVFGKTFFDDDASLLIDDCADDSAAIEERIERLADEIRAFLLQKGMWPSIATLDGIADEEDPEITYRRFLALTNYLKKTGDGISITEFIYVTRDLYLL